MASPSSFAAKIPKEMGELLVEVHKDICLASTKIQSQNTTMNEKNPHRLNLDELRWKA